MTRAKGGDIVERFTFRLRPQLGLQQASYCPSGLVGSRTWGSEFLVDIVSANDHTQRERRLRSALQGSARWE